MWHRDMAKKKEPRLNMVVTDDLLRMLDAWRARQGYPIPNRSEAARRILEERCAKDLGAQ